MTNDWQRVVSDLRTAADGLEQLAQRAEEAQTARHRLEAKVRDMELAAARAAARLDGAVAAVERDYTAQLDRAQQIVDLAMGVMEAVERVIPACAAMLIDAEASRLTGQPKEVLRPCGTCTQCVYRDALQRVRDERAALAAASTPPAGP